MVEMNFRGRSNRVSSGEEGKGRWEKSMMNLVFCLEQLEILVLFIEMGRGDSEVYSVCLRFYNEGGGSGIPEFCVV